MKFVIISELFFPALGGQEVRYAELIPYLTRKGHEVVVLTIDHLGVGDSREMFKGARVIRCFRDAEYLVKGTGKGRTLRSIFGFTISLLKHWRTIQEADVVLFNKWPILPQLVFGRLVPGGCVDWCEIRRGFVWSLLYASMARSTCRHIGVSDEIIAYLGDKQKVISNRLCTVLSGVTPNNYRRSVGERIQKQVLFFGRMAEHKDPAILLRVFLTLCPPNTGCRLVMAGTGELLGALKAEADGANNVIFTGRISDEEKVRLLGQSALLVLPSKREGFPRVIAEASAAGTPTLTVDHPMNGGARVVNQYGLGWVCSATEMALAEAISKYSDVTSREWVTVSKNCLRMTDEHFDWEKVSDKLISFLKS